MMSVSLKIGRFQFSGETIFIEENLISETTLVFFSAVPQVGCFFLRILPQEPLVPIVFVTRIFVFHFLS